MDANIIPQEPDLRRKQLYIHRQKNKREPSNTLPNEHLKLTGANNDVKPKETIQSASLAGSNLKMVEMKTQRKTVRPNTVSMENKSIRKDQAITTNGEEKNLSTTSHSTAQIYAQPSEDYLREKIESKIGEMKPSIGKFAQNQTKAGDGSVITTNEIQVKEAQPQSHGSGQQFNQEKLKRTPSRVPSLNISTRSNKSLSSRMRRCLKSMMCCQAMDAVTTQNMDLYAMERQTMLHGPHQAYSNGKSCLSHKPSVEVNNNTTSKGNHSKMLPKKKSKQRQENSVIVLASSDDCVSISYFPSRKVDYPLPRNRRSDTSMDEVKFDLRIESQERLQPQIEWGSESTSCCRFYENDYSSDLKGGLRDSQPAMMTSLSRVPNYLTEGYRNKWYPADIKLPPCEEAQDTSSRSTSQSCSPRRTYHPKYRRFDQTSERSSFLSRKEMRRGSLEQQLGDSHVMTESDQIFDQNVAELQYPSFEQDTCNQVDFDEPPYRMDYDNDRISSISNRPDSLNYEEVISSESDIETPSTDYGSLASLSEVRGSGPSKKKSWSKRSTSRSRTSSYRSSLRSRDSSDQKSCYRPGSGSPSRGSRQPASSKRDGQEEPKKRRAIIGGAVLALLTVVAYVLLMLYFFV